MYTEGKGVQQSFPKAVELYEQAHHGTQRIIWESCTSRGTESSKVFPRQWSFTSRLTRLYLKLLVTLDREDMERGEMDGDSILRLSPATLVLQ